MEDNRNDIERGGQQGGQQAPGRQGGGQESAEPPRPGPAAVTPSVGRVTEDRQRYRSRSSSTSLDPLSLGKGPGDQEASF